MPGVSMTLILVEFHSAQARLAESVCLREISSVVLVTVVPSSTRPRRGVAPAEWSRAAINWVLPAPPWPTTATLRILPVSYAFMAAILRSRVNARGPFR